MKCLYSNAACGGMDVHYKFSNVTFRDSAGNVVRRERLEHPQRDQLRERISRWPKGTPVVLEASSFNSTKTQFECSTPLTPPSLNKPGTTFVEEIGTSLI